MSETITIAGNSARIRLDIDGYENTSPVDESDANWLRAKLDFTVGPFAAKLTMALMTYDLVRFLEQLQNAYESGANTAEFVTLERAIQCTIDVRRNGQAAISGVIQIDDAVQASLSFAFESDQSFIRDTLTQLEMTMLAFPVREI